MKFWASALGVVLGFFFVGIAWTPFVKGSWETEVKYEYIKEPDKQRFFLTFSETFESENPQNEDLNHKFDSRPEDLELYLAYERFDGVRKKILSKGCPEKRVAISTRWADIEARDRVFNVFDVENCKNQWREMK